VEHEGVAQGNAHLHTILKPDVFQRDDRVEPVAPEYSYMCRKQRDRSGCQKLGYGQVRNFADEWRPSLN
jgi:hypothetical protein